MSLLRSSKKGSPKVGEENFYQLFEETVPLCHRLVLKYDPVRKLPPAIPGFKYKHVGEKVFLLEPKGNRFLAVTPLAHHYEYYLESIRATRKSVMPGKKFLNS